MRKFTRILIALAVLSAAVQQDFGALYRLIEFPLALALYVFAVAVVLAVMLSPFAFALAAWLLWRRHRTGRFPGWATNIAQRARRLTADRIAHSRAVAVARRVARRLPRLRPRESAGPSMRPGPVCPDCPLNPGPAGESQTAEQTPGTRRTSAAASARDVPTSS
jgi:hypothetical protein